MNTIKYKGYYFIREMEITVPWSNCWIKLIGQTAEKQGHCTFGFSSNATKFDLARELDISFDSGIFLKSVASNMVKLCLETKLKTVFFMSKGNHTFLQ